MQHFHKDALCEEGRVFLSDRGLSIPVALAMGVASANGDIGFPYTINGKIVRVKTRNMQDKKKMRFSMGEADIKLPFWNAQIWPTSDHLILTEGEFDSIAIAQLGPYNVASLPNGAGSVVTSFKNNYDYLQKFDVIYIAFDMDEAGEKAAEEAKKLLPMNKFRRIVFPAKDANEWIAQNPHVDKKDFDHLMRNAVKVCADEIVHFKHLPKIFYEAMDTGTPTGWREIDRLIGGIRAKEVTVVSADTGAGKTTFCVNLACNLLHRNPAGIWINSWEMDHNVIVRKVASQVLGKRFKTEAFSKEERVLFDAWMEKHNAFINPKRSNASIATLRRQLELATKVYGIRYVMLDHLDYISDASSNKSAENHERIKEAVSAIHDMAMEFDVHIFLIAHMKQTSSADSKPHMGQIKGSAAVKQYADNVLMLENKNDPANPDNRLIVSVQKNRFFGSRGEVTLRYLKERDSFVDNSEIFQPRSSYEN